MISPQSTPSASCLVIAEAGVNHNGDMDLALRLVEEGAAAGAHIVKFQTFDAKKLVTIKAPTADYQKRNFDAGDTQLKMLQALELSEHDHRVLSDRCDALGVEFLSTPFDIESARFLVDTMGVKRIKVGSAVAIPLARRTAACPASRAVAAISQPRARKALAKASPT